MSKYIIAFLVAIGMIVLVFVLFLSGSSSKNSTKPSITISGATDTVQMTIDGPEAANQTHNSVQISINQGQATINILQGYQGTVVNSASYLNNQAAYTVLLHALNLASFTKPRSTSLTDERGVCPLGNRYIYEVIRNAKDVQRQWATSCGGQGTFGGKLSLVNTLFENQIPDFSKLTGELNLSSSSF